MNPSFSLVDLSIFIVSLLIAMTVHEAMHAYVGLMLGDTTAEEQGRISLNPSRHIDPIYTVALPIVTYILFQAPILAAKPVPFNPYRVRFGEWGAALIALAGPVSNLALAVVASLILRVIGMDSFIGYALAQFLEINVLLFIFNLVPIPPLDGSRVLFAFAPEPLQDLMRQIEPYGMYIIFGLVLLGGFGGWLDSLNQMVLQVLL
jgi:Zn-dependent protease